jgi:hypothetical protein
MHIYKESAAHEEDNGKGFNPNTLPLQTRPDKASGGESSTNNIFGLDDRFAFRDTIHPYSTVGKIHMVTGSTCAGTMVGRNLMLTANHCIKSGSWMKFTPSYYDGSEPYDSAYVMNYLHWFADDASTSTITTFETAFDYALVVLDRNISDDVSNMGYTTYNLQWNSGDY